MYTYMCISTYIQYAHTKLAINFKQIMFANRFQFNPTQRKTLLLVIIY